MPADECRHAAAITMPTAEYPPLGATVDRRAWRRKAESALIRARHEGTAPIITDERDGLLLVWVIEDRLKPLRLVQLDVRDPALSPPTRAKRWLRASSRSRFPLSAVSQRPLAIEGPPNLAVVLTIAGATVVTVANGLVGGLLEWSAALLGGGLAGGWSYPLLRARADREWRAIDLPQRVADHPSSLVADLCLTLVEAHGLAYDLARRDDAEPSAWDAVNAIRWLAWSAAAIDSAGDLRALDPIDTATRELRDRLTAVRLSPLPDPDAPELTPSTALPPGEQPRARARHEHHLEEAESAIELARQAGAELRGSLAERGGGGSR